MDDATAPAFAEVAVGAMAKWWFLPKIVDGHAVESAATVPFEQVLPKA